MNHGCPNIECSFFSKSTFIQKDGFYYRRDDARKIQRYRCLSCLKKFSQSTETLEYKQKKRRVNHTLFKLLASGISMRRAAIVLGIHRTTVDRKFLYLSKKSKTMHAELLLKIGMQKITHLQIDDLITIEHTKLKPLSVSIAVDGKKRTILGIHVSSIAAFGHLAKISRIKYGKRKNTHKESMIKLFNEISSVISPFAEIKSDEHTLYPEIIKSFFPKATHLQYKGERAKSSGLGELKKNGRDPLFTINHTCAMLRANINRLFRKTWCTTKKLSKLEDHLHIYMAFHNQTLIS